MNAGSREPMVSLENVHLSLESAAGPVNILRGASLAVESGETLSVVGPSGSGKTTMIMIIAGLERQTSGRVAINGTDLGGLSEDQLALFRRDAIGIVFQNFHLVPTMSALENVAVPLELAGADDPFDRAREALASVELDHRLEHFPGQLSGGEQQRVAIARAFVGGPRLLLGDEPTGNLDGGTGSAVMDLLFDLHARHGTPLILITHNPEIAARCDRGVRLADGLIISDEQAGFAT